MAAFDVQVCGSGIVGHSLALSLARLGLRVALRPDPVHADADAGADVRAYALNAASVALLTTLKVWPALPLYATTAVHDMHVQGDVPGAVLDFSGWEQRVGELAWIVDAAVLERELAAAARFSPHISITGDEVKAPLMALCEGKASATRESLGVEFERHDYGQRAIAARLRCSAPHRGIARQWFRSPDVLALLPTSTSTPTPTPAPTPADSPQARGSYALVWSLPEERAQALLAMDGDTFARQLMLATDGAAGELELTSQRASWPLMRATAGRWCGPGWVLLGDAAHVVHPLAGQGLNLGLADVAALTDVIAKREPWRELGDAKLLRRYVRERLAATQAMSHLTDGLLRLFAHDAPAARELRNRGMSLVNQLRPVKRWLTARALSS